MIFLGTLLRLPSTLILSVTRCWPVDTNVTPIQTNMYPTPAPSLLSRRVSRWRPVLAFPLVFARSFVVAAFPMSSHQLPFSSPPCHVAASPTPSTPSVPQGERCLLQWPPLFPSVTFFPPSSLSLPLAVASWCLPEPCLLHALDVITYTYPSTSRFGSLTLKGHMLSWYHTQNLF